MSTLSNYFRKFRPDKTSNLKVVVLCVVTATTFWLLNALNKDNYTTVVDQPILIQFDEEEYMAVKGLPNEVKIEINGNGWDLLKKHLGVSQDPLEITLEDPSHQPYLVTEEITQQMSEHISTTNLVSIVQDTLFFSIDKIVSKKIQIVPDTLPNTLAENHDFASRISIDPEYVSVRGPISIIEQLDGKLLVQLGENNIKNHYSKLLPLELDKTKKDFLTLDEETVQISFQVVAFIEKTLKLDVKKLYFPANVDIEGDVQSVTLQFLVDERKQNDLESLNLSAILNYNNRNREDSSIAVSLNVNRSFLRDITFSPDSFDLIYE
ncbi:YbbR-like domain-containing protein [Cyclobacterium amurskyense]|uniref:YbbR-like domain-containing protein n=1 Tax=Cyclobacterium amurskyense TaxID=320787 RepID=UPI0030DAE312